MDNAVHITFPMRIEATDLFDTIHQQAKRWRAELDNTNRTRSLFKVAKDTPSMLQPRSATGTSGRRVNLLA